MPEITIATAPKPFTNPHIATIQRNAIQSWVHLGSEVEVVLVGDEMGMAETAAEIGVPHLKDVERNSSGTPLVSSIFDLMRGHSHSPILVYVNADILFMPDFVTAINHLRKQSQAFLGVGQRWDLEVLAKLEFSPGWEGKLREGVISKGSLHAPVGSDYFVFPRTILTQIPDFAIGRAGWDNWMIYEARQRGWPVVDMTADVMVVHQNHDYSHLPGGQPHYRLPETADNTRMAGGRRAIFNLQDADFALRDGKIIKIPLQGVKLKREIEIFPLIRLHSRLLGELFFALFHPVQALGEVKGWFYKLAKKILRKGKHA
jgi:hypothetical protein